MIVEALIAGVVVVLVACGCASAQEQAQNSAYQIRYTIQDLGGEIQAPQRMGDLLALNGQVHGCSFVGSTR